MVLAHVDIRILPGQGPLSPEFRAIVEPYFAQTPVMQHFELVEQGPAPTV